MRKMEKRKRADKGNSGRPKESNYVNVRALYDCLSYLEEEARRVKLSELSHLIGVAASSAEETAKLLTRSTNKLSRMKE